MKRQKWVDVWDGTKYAPQEEVAASTVAPPETSAAPATDPIDGPVSSPTGKDGVRTKDMDVGKSLATEDEPGTPPPTQGSATYEVNNSSEHTKTSLPENTGDVKSNETGDTCSHVSSDAQKLEPPNTELHSDKGKPNGSKISTGRVDLNSPGAKAMLRGLQNSRWAQEDAKETQGAYRSPAKLPHLRQLSVAPDTPVDQRDSTGLDIPPSRASEPGPTQQGIDVAVKSDPTEMHSQVEEPVAVKPAIEPDYHSFERKAAKLEQEQREQRPGNEAHDLPHVQPRDTWQSWKSDSESHPSLGQALDEDNHPPSERPPAQAEATNVPLTSGALCAEFGSCPKDRSDSPDPMTRVSATGIDNAEENPAHSTFDDPRGQDPVEQYQEQDWNETRRPKPKKLWETDSISSGDDFIVPGPFYEFLLWWAAGIPDIKSHFLQQNVLNHQLCDVDTVTGNLIEPVQYPVTIRSLGVDSAKLNRTAQDVINQAMMQLKSAVDKATRKKARRAAAAREAAMSREMDEAAKAEQIQAECYLRPATNEDIDEVTAIYNREVAESHSVFDTAPVTVEKFRTLLQVCQTLKQPFIVAVEGWHYPDADTSNRRVLGFCCVDMSDKGITGSRDSIANGRGNITLIVHRDWRRKKIGTALLDVVVSCCSTNYTCKEGYQWVGTPGDKSYMSARYNSRQDWHMVQMVVLVKSKKSKEEAIQQEKWLVDFLEATLPFALKKHDHQFAYRPRMEGNEATPGWIDRLTFEHQCRPHSLFGGD